MSLGISLQWQLPSVFRSTRASTAESRTPDVSLSLSTAPFGRALRCSTIPNSSILTGNRATRISSIRCLSALDPNLKSTLDKVVTSQKIVLFMKGTKEFPQCGFSNTVVQILKSLNAPFETINILENEALRQGLKEYSSWPTFPQLYIDGEFFGGCDITVEAYKSGELQELLERTLCS
ncbi:Monothiol glutaredoxin-S7, chloroplastic [Datura stramonium]|uniref:Monothiol glutaredoxin-S7, chloroplastic n=1 Tax=Datura stramonium TaxID=4076 RepID=A0ABS8SI08_DATST|nr:Monothiol glutaredoxin-S7, chloroplastic [Datura stramonium]